MERDIGMKPALALISLLALVGCGADGEPQKPQKPQVAGTVTLSNSGASVGTSLTVGGGAFRLGLGQVL